ncbi:MAG: SDR family oxidoreductase [Bacteroidetes bacterium]|nr:SDR family oxidoreductase [Bacteroidota bacterium]MBU1681095.1 SDR family oxidoreductase [Bacteroidota bacterium]MBU2506872.1 SDR family oxidoreductase [Bacteroidota bacterium]
MEGKIVLVTGSTAGIGLQTAVDLALLGAEVLIHGRNEERCINAQNFVLRETGKSCRYFTGDLSSFESIGKMADNILSDYERLDVLINNAGIYMNEKMISKDGFEMTFAVNHLAPFYLTNLLLDLLKKSGSGRIINVSSVAHLRGKIDFHNLNAEKHFDGYGVYSMSKLANVLFTNYLAERLKDDVVTVNSLHPGVITTKLLKAGFNMCGASLQEGAATSVYLASSDEARNVTGKYFDKSRIAVSSSDSVNIDIQKRLWEVSEEITGVKYW